jgi:hypothetical protein
VALSYFAFAILILFFVSLYVFVFLMWCFINTKIVAFSGSTTMVLKIADLKDKDKKIWHEIATLNF